MLCCAAGMAQKFKYELIDSESVKVTGYDGELPSETTIPEVLEDDGNTFTVTSIGDEAFANCSTIVKLNLPSTLTSIGQGAFEKCAYLNQVELPASLVSLPNNPFRFCPRLNSVTIDPNNTAFKVIDDVVYNADVTKLLLYPGGKGESTFVVPDGVITIGSYAFAGNANFYDLTFPNSTETLQQAALLGCTYLQHVHFGAGIKYILAPQFIKEWGGEPYGITTVDFANTETGPYIKEVFNLETMPDLSIYIPLGRRDLYKTSEVEISSTTGPEPTGWADIIGDVIEQGYADYDENTSPLFYRSIKGNENKVAVSQNSSMKIRYKGDVTVPESITANGVSYSVDQIGEYAFYDSEELSAVILPATIQLIGYEAFSSTPNLWYVSVDENSEYFVVEEGVLYDYAKEELIVLPAAYPAISLTTPESVMTISSGAIMYSKTLTYFSSNAKYVCANNFYECPALKEIYLTNPNLERFDGRRTGCPYALYFLETLTPPVMGTGESYYDCYLIVDPSAVDAYKNAEDGNWGTFGAILSKSGATSFNDNEFGGHTEAAYVESLSVTLNLTPGVYRSSYLPFAIPMGKLYELGIEAFYYDEDYEHRLGMKDGAIMVQFKRVLTDFTPVETPMILRLKEGETLESFELENVLIVDDNITSGSLAEGYNYEAGVYSAFYPTVTLEDSPTASDMSSRNAYSLGGGVLGRVSNSGASIPPYRWYFVPDVNYAPTSSSPLRVSISGLGEDSETVLESINESAEPNIPIYNLSGQRVVAPSQPGLYVQGGAIKFVKQ